MKLFPLTTLCLASLLTALSGCADSAKTPPAAGSMSSAAVDKDEAKIQAALAQLPEEDRKLAEAQKTCPIGKDRLGSMGVPVKVDVNGKPVFICCDGCRSALLAQAEKEKAAAAPAAPAAEESKPVQN